MKRKRNHLPLDGGGEVGVEGRVAIVTGGSQGIGLATASALAAAGCAVTLSARHEAALSRAKDRIARAGGTVLAIPADLTQPAAVRRVVARTLQHFGRVDILVNNVGGLCRDRPFLKLRDADWWATLELNLMTTVRVCRAVIPHMQKQRAGHIINIASTAGLDQGAAYPDYRASKAALIALGQALSVALAADGILVNTLCPGPVWTASWTREARMKARKTGKSIEEMAHALRAGVASTIPLGRMGHVDDVARLVAFLASPNTTWMTGSVIRMDGGTTPP